MSDYRDGLPVPEEYQSSVISVGIGYNITCAVGSNFQAGCWETATAEDTDGIPEELTAGVQAICVTTTLEGTPHACILTLDGDMRCFALDGSDGDAALVNVPAAAEANVTAISCGYDYACAVMADGQLICFGGENAYGQTSVPEPLGPVAVVSAGQSTTCAVNKTEHLHCWGMISNVPRELEGVKGLSFVAVGADIIVDATGDNLGPVVCVITNNQQLRCFDSTLLFAQLPRHVRTNVAAVTVNTYTTCVLHVDDMLECWWPGLGLEVPREARSGAEALAVGFDHVCVLLAGEAQLNCFGIDDYGEAQPPEEIQAGGVLAVSANYEHTCAINNASSLLCWGANWSGQTDVPEQLSMPNSVRSVSAAGLHTCAIDTDEQLVCFGANDYNQSVIPPELEAVGVRAVECGDEYTCAITLDDELYCFGLNENGQLDVPEEFRRGIASVTAGVAHTCAIASDGRLGCWGSNDYLQSSVPPAFSSSIKSASVSFDQTCAVAVSGFVQCWGNGVEDLGTPEAFADGVEILDVGASYSCAIKGDAEATVGCWGNAIKLYVPEEAAYLGPLPGTEDEKVVNEGNNEENKGDNNGSMLGIALGIGVGSGILLAVLAAAAFLLLRRRRRDDHTSKTVPLLFPDAGSSMPISPADLEVYKLQKLADAASAKGSATGNGQPPLPMATLESYYQAALDDESLSLGDGSTDRLTFPHNSNPLSALQSQYNASLGQWEAASRQNTDMHALPPGVMSMDAASPPEMQSTPPAKQSTTGSVRSTHSHTSFVVKEEDLLLYMKEDNQPVEVGRGGFSTVLAGRLRDHNVAVKVMKHGASNENAVYSILREVAVLRKCHHPNVVRFEGACFEGPNGLLLVFELLEGGTLFNALHSAGGAKFMWGNAAGLGAALALGVARGIEYLHARRLVHCDIKSPNILLTADKATAKVGDLGMAKFLVQNLVSKAGQLGTFAWAAPELLADSRVDEKVDIYSFGVILWELVTGELPVRGDRRKPRVPEECSEGVFTLMQACLSTNPNTRPTASEVVAALEVEAAAQLVV